MYTICHRRRASATYDKLSDIFSSVTKNTDATPSIQILCDSEKALHIYIYIIGRGRELEELRGYYHQSINKRMGPGSS